MEICISINKSKEIQNASLYKPYIWQVPIYSFQVNLPPFYDVDGSISMNIVNISTFEIDEYNYQKKNTIAQLTELSYCQIGEVIYFMNNGKLPAWLIGRASVGIAIGLTTGKTFIKDATRFNAGLNYYPSIKLNGNAIRSNIMQFNSDSITVDISTEKFGDVETYFGNLVNVYIKDREMYLLNSLYIKKTTYNIDGIKFNIADSRERLKIKVPNEVFTVEKFPYMQNPGNTTQKSIELGNIIQDVYGFCLNVKAVCIDPFEIYQNGDKKLYRTFKVARKITSLDNIWVKMTQPSSGSDVLVDQISHATIDNENGTFTLDISYCMPWWTGTDVPEIFEIYVTGIFCPQQTPKDILIEILSYYANIEFNNTNYNVEEVEEEISGLAPVGICLKSSIDLFKAIEIIQNSSTIPFEFISKNGKFTTIRNDNNKPVVKTIKNIDILNINEISEELDINNYATSIDVLYSIDERKDNGEILSSDKNREALLEIYHVEKKEVFNTNLINKEDAEIKIKLLEYYYKRPRFTMSNIKVFGLDFFELDLYDIVNIYATHDVFGHNFKAKIIEIIKDYLTQIVTLKVVFLENISSSPIAILSNP